MAVIEKDALQARTAALLDWINSETSFTTSKLTMVSGDASFRRYFRFTWQQTSYIAVDAPPEKENNPAFYQIATQYLAAGVRVPEIKAVDLELGFWVLQDLGDKLLAHCFEQNDIESLYQSALNVLPAIQQVTSTEAGSLSAFDDELLDNEFYLFNHWLLQVHLDLPLTDKQQQVIQEAQLAIRDIFKAQPQVGVHRDYHSRNLMVLDDGAPGIIDFQDAVIGPVTYDAVSLLRDCYVIWPEDMVDKLIEQWRSENYPQYDAEEFRVWFDFVGMQRHIKASGIFCRLCHRDGKQGYLADVPRTLQYIVTFGERYPQTREFAELLRDVIIPAVQAKKAA